MNRALWLAGGLTGVLVWLASPELEPLARFACALLLGPAPVASFHQTIAAETLPRPLPRNALYLGTMAGLWLLGIGTFLAGLFSGFTPHLMGLNSLTITLFMAWTLFAILACGAVVLAFKGFGYRDTELMREIVPVTRSEKRTFVGVSLSAGICEEIAFRSFLVPALTVATGSLIAGVAVSSVAFGLLHAHQKMGGAIRAMLLGTILALPLVLTGSIYPSIVAHTLIDIVAGLYAARWLMDETGR